jgi:hypothetical protein
MTKPSMILIKKGYKELTLTLAYDWKGKLEAPDNSVSQNRD